MNQGLCFVSGILNTKTHRWVSLLICRRKQKQHSQPDLSGMLFPQLICLVNSYSSFETQIRYHLLRKAFHAHPPPQAWFRCFPTLCCPSPWGSSVPGFSTLSCNYFPATKVQVGVGFAQSGARHRLGPGHLGNTTEMQIPGPWAHTYWIYILISPTPRWFLCILRTTALEYELLGSKDCALFILCAGFTFIKCRGIIQ